MAAAKGYKFARLYTDALDNDVAITFYKANGYVCEPYQNERDPACMIYKTVIFSKSLSGGEMVLWNNRSIHLTEQIAKQEKYSIDDMKYYLFRCSHGSTAFAESYTGLEKLS